MDQPGKVANPARDQLKRGNVFFPVPGRAFDFSLKTTLHGGQSRSWSAEQGKDKRGNKKKSLWLYYDGGKVKRGQNRRKSMWYLCLRTLGFFSRPTA